MELTADSRPYRPALILLPTLAIGGTERKFVRIANALAQRGLPVCLGYFNEPTDLIRELMPEVRLLHLHRRGKYSLASLIRLVRFVAANEVGAVVGANFYPLSYMYPAARLLRRREVAWISSINTTRFLDSRQRHFMVLNAPLLRRMDRVVFGCENQRRHWVATYGLPEARASVVYNGVDTAYFCPDSTHLASRNLRDKLGFGEHDLMLVSIGMLRPEKGQLDVVEALSLLISRMGRDLPHIGLILVGEGPQRSKIEARINALGLGGRVALPGAAADVRAYLELADLFVLPSHSETFSNAALEAASMAVPLLLSDVDGNRELVEHGNSGLLFDVGDPESLAAKITELAQDEQKRRCLAERARRAAEAHFSLEDMVERWTEVLWPAADRPIRSKLRR